jgi:hypothetical protein
MDETPGQSPIEPPGGAETLSEDELREAYAAELRRISSADLILQTTASLINVGAYRLGLTGGEEADRDLEQVRDAIDGVRGLLPILERRADAQQLRPLRDALSQLQMAYAREVQPEAGTAGAGAGAGGGAQPEPAAAGSEGGRAAADQEPASSPRDPDDAHRPGPAESSGRLWVPGSG